MAERMQENQGAQQAEAEHSADGDGMIIRKEYRRAGFVLFLFGSFIPDLCFCPEFIFGFMCCSVHTLLFWTLVVGDVVMFGGFVNIGENCCAKRKKQEISALVEGSPLLHKVHQ